MHDCAPAAAAAFVAFCHAAGCHAANVSAGQRLNPQEWTGLVQSMAVRGAVATDEELKQISTYLAKSFPKTDTTVKP